MTDNEFPQRFSAALVSEIKAEMGRRDLSSRGLALLIGQSSQYVSQRLDGGNSRTGERVTLNVRDLAAISDALGVNPTSLVERARSAAMSDDLDNVSQIRLPAPPERVAAKRGRKNETEGTQ